MSAFHASNKIHGTVIIEGDVQLGVDNEILQYTTLRGPLKIGNGNRIGPNVVVGSPGQDTRNPRYDDSNCKIEIGDRNIIREFTAIQKPCYRDITRLGSDIFLMQSVHIPHDAIIEDYVVITPMTVLAGITRIMKGANLGLGAAIQQHVVVGQYTLVAMNAAVSKNIKPFSRYIPGKPLSVNEYAIEKFGFTENADEIRDYVLKNTMPTSNKINAIVDAFSIAHVASKREMY